MQYKFEIWTANGNSGEAFDTMSDAITYGMSEFGVPWTVRNAKTDRQVYPPITETRHDDLF